MNLKMMTVAMTVAAAASASMGQAFSDDFSSWNSAGWGYSAPLANQGAAANVTALGELLRLTSDPSPNPSLYGIARIAVSGPAAAATPTNSYQRVDVVGFDGRSGQLAALGFRMTPNGGGTTRGYYLLMGTTNAEGTSAAILFNRITDGNGVTLGNYGYFSCQPGENFRLEVETTGINFIGRVYRLSEPDVPIAEVSAFSGVIPSGVSGVGAFGRGAPVVVNCPLDMTYDNFYVSGVCGRADMGSAGGAFGPDGHLDNNDFIVFIDRFFRQDSRADMGVQGGEVGTDGQWDNNDFIAFIDQFFQGCA